MLRTTTTSALEGVPGLVHGFEQRVGSPDPPGAVGPSRGESREASRRRVAQALEGRGRLLLLKQVHGSSVAVAPWEGTPEADAAVARGPRLLLAVETADCLPILIVDSRRRAVAVAHAGWRGTASGVATRAIEALVAGGSDPEDLQAALGPSIGPCCYEVGEELRAAFGPAGAAFFRPGPRGRPHLDVRAANRGQLLAAGLRPHRIHEVRDCTACRPDLYHSYRRDGAGAGRMISFVGWER